MFCGRNCNFVRTLNFWLRIEIVDPSLLFQRSTPFFFRPVGVQLDTMLIVPLFLGKVERQVLRERT